jgi:hypothetical protein
VFLFVAAFALLPRMTTAQGWTGALIGTVTDERGGVLVGAGLRISSPALIGSPLTGISNAKGRLRFPALPPGLYVLDIEVPGFITYHEADILIGAGATIEITATLKLAAIRESVVVEGAGSFIEARDPGFRTRFGPEDLAAIPTRRAGVFDFIRAAPGVSPTSPASGTNTSVSAFGSGTNENAYFVDGMNFTAPSNGGARADPGIEFTQEIQVQSVGASAEYGNVQGAVINVVTRQGSNRFLYEASYYEQPAGLTSQPVRLRIPDSGGLQSGYDRARYRDFATNLGGPAARDRLWFFAGYEYLRDFDSQPGTDPKLPRTNEQDKIFAKLTWRLAPRWHLVQSFHDEFWVGPEQPTIARPFEATLRQQGSVPAMTFGHLTHTWSANTVWDMRVGRFAFSQEDNPSTGTLRTPSRFDQATKFFSGAPPQIGNVKGIRTAAKATLSHYRPGLVGADHEWRIGGQIESGEHRSLRVIPTGSRFIDNNGFPSQSISSDPSNAGGRVFMAAAFASDAVTLRNWLTINAGVRFDHSRASSQDLRELDSEGHDTGAIVHGLGTLYSWNVWSPRLGLTAKLTADGRTLLRASYGRYSQGVMTGEISPLHRGVTPITTRDWVPADGAYSNPRSVVDGTNLQLDPDTRPPRTDEYSIGVDREVGRLAVAIAYVRKDGADFIGWTDTGGQYRQDTRTLDGSRTVPVFELVNGSPARLFRLTNPDGYSLTYNGLVIAVDIRRTNGWQAFGSYTLSRAYGLQPSSGTTAAGGQVSTVGAPPIMFGRDPNDLTNARGRLPNDRPHMFRVMGTADVPRTGVVIAANLQYFSGKPWAATALIPLLPPQSRQQRVLLEPRGSRRLSSQTLLDVRVSRAVSVGGRGRIEVILDVLNALNDTAEEGLVTDELGHLSFGQPNVFVDPRRVMVSVRLNLGR